MPVIPDLAELPRNLKSSFFAELALQCEALADGQRLELVFSLLRDGESSVEELGDRLNQPPQELICHLTFLEKAELVARRRAGRQIYYSLETDAVPGVMERLQKLAGHAFERATPLVNNASLRGISSQSPSTHDTS